MNSLANILIEKLAPSQIYAIKYDKNEYQHCEYFVDTSIENIVNLYFAVLVDFYSSEFDEDNYEEDRHLYFNDIIKERVLNCSHDLVSRISCIKMFISEKPKNIKIMVPGDDGLLIDMDDDKIFTMLGASTHIDKKMDQQSIIANIIAQYTKPQIYFLSCVHYENEIFVSDSVNKVINYCFELLYCWFASKKETDENKLGYKLTHCGTDIESRKKILRENTVGDNNYFADSIDFQFIGSNYEPYHLDDKDILEMFK
jgi:hypothetical protein